MGFVLLRENADKELYRKLVAECATKKWEHSFLSFNKTPNAWCSADAVAFAASIFFGARVDCVEVPAIHLTFFATSYSELIYKISIAATDDAVSSMKLLGEVAQQHIKLDALLENLRVLEDSLVCSYTELTGTRPDYVITDEVNLEDVIDQYSTSTPKIRGLLSTWFPQGN
jgi:hypothetical protein